MPSKIQQYQEEVINNFNEEVVDKCWNLPSLTCRSQRLSISQQEIIKDFIISALQGQLKVVEEENKEVCLCAAIITFDGSQIIRGHRHCDCFARLYEMKLKAGEQGFLTNKGRFVTRLEGRRLQNEAKIQSISPDGYQGNTLYSEDLY